MFYPMNVLVDLDSSNTTLVLRVSNIFNYNWILCSHEQICHICHAYQFILMYKLKYNFIDVSIRCPARGQLWPSSDLHHLVFTWNGTFSIINGFCTSKYCTIEALHIMLKFKNLWFSGIFKDLTSGHFGFMQIYQSCSNLPFGQSSWICSRTWWVIQIN